MAATRAGLGRTGGISGRGSAQGGGARLCRHLCQGSVRRQRPHAARCRADLRGIGHRLRLDRRLSLDPQHGGLDDRPLWRRGAARPLSAEADVDGAFRELLPDRAGQRLGRRGIADLGAARRRRLRPERHQGLHLGRRHQRYLCRDGAHRRGRPEGHFLPGYRERREGPLLWQEREKARLEHAADRDGHLRGLPCARRQPARRRGRRLRDRDDGARWRAPEYRCLLLGRRAGLL